MSQLHYPSGYSVLIERLQGFGAFRKRWAWFHGLAWFVLLGPGSLLALAVLDEALPLPWFVLLPLFALSMGVTLYGAIRYALLPLFRAIELEREAVVIESLHGKLDNQVIGSYQLAQEVAEASARGQPVGYSAAIVSALVSRTAEHIRTLDLPRLVDRRHTFRNLALAMAIALAFVAIAVASPAFYARRAAHLHDSYATLMDLLFPVAIKVTPGDAALVRGKAITLGLQVSGARQPNVRLVRINLKSHKTITNELKLDHDHAGFDIPSAEESFTYRFEYGSQRSSEHKILVGDLPAIAAMNTELSYPAYTALPARTLVGRLPKLSALPGTGVLVSIASTVDLHPDLSYVTWQDGARQPLSVTGRFGHFSFTVDRPERATIHLTGSLGKGFEMPEPLSFEVAVQRDMPPTVEVLIRNKNQTMLAEEATHFLVNAIAEDDFGVAEVLLDYKIDTIDPLLNRPKRSGTVSRLIEPARDRVKVSFADVFKALSPPLEPGDRITITVSAKDNNSENPAGPGVGRATPIEIVIVRPDLGAYVEQRFGFGSDPLLGGLRKVKRETNLLIEAERTAHTEAKAKIEKQDVKSRVGAESWPGGAQDAVGDYFRLLSGEK